MKNLLLATIATLFISCASVPEAPQPSIPLGFTFELPCPTHDKHQVVVTEIQSSFMYTVVNDEGMSQFVDELTLIEVLNSWGIDWTSWGDK